MPISAVDTSSITSENDPHYEDRINLAAVFRMTARLDMDEAVGNHFSYAVSDDGNQFLINPFGRHFSNIRASELLLLNAREEVDMDQPDKPDPTAWAIHGAMHRNVPQARTACAFPLCNGSGFDQAGWPAADRPEQHALFQSNYA
jgi:hypothetical protein